MTAENVFSACNALALAGWLVLIFAGKNAKARLFTGVILPLTIALIYCTLLVLHLRESHGNFSTLAGVAALFANPWMLLAGWIHYLAFDLFIGAWEARDAQAHGVSHLLVIPCLALTFLFGPVGLLLYFSVRTARLKTVNV